MALQALYLTDSCNISLDIAVKATLSKPLPQTVRVFCQELVHGVDQKREEIDKILSRYTENWNIKRMATVDRNILRLSTYEILHDLGTPVSVIINEAIEIAKTYSTEDSGKFVNGILDKVKAERKKP